MRPFKLDRLTVADLLACKGKRQLTQVLVKSVEEAAAAEAAGIEMVNLAADALTKEYREVMPRAFVTVGLEYGMHVTAEDYIRSAFAAMRVGADAVYCAASVAIIARMYAEGIPVCSHAGLIPSRCTWTGGYKAVGRNAESALNVWNRVRQLEEAGAFAVEMEVVPDRIAGEISKRTRMLVISMGGGAYCDGQYLFAEDILGTNTGHYPRHSKRYRDFAAEYRRLQQERIAAFGEFRRDVETGSYPAPEHSVRVDDGELAKFLRDLPPLDEAPKH